MGDDILNEEFLTKYGIKNFKTNVDSIGGYVLIVEFTNGDIVKERINNIFDIMGRLLKISNIRSRKKKLKKIMKRL